MVCHAGIGSQPQGEKKAWSILSSILKNGEFLVFEYSSDSDALLFYDSELKVCETIPNYRTYLNTKSSIHPDGRQTIVNLYHGKCHEPAEIRLCYNDVLTHCLAYALSFDEPEYRGRRIFVLRNITEERNREKFLEKQATLDPLTMLLTSTFPLAIEQLMKIIGYRFRLDRITVIRTDIHEKHTGRQYQWTSEYAPSSTFRRTL